MHCVACGWIAIG
jgi:hypothetical protein